MKSSSYIDNVVYLTNVFYQKKMNKTKVMFFEYLSEGKSVEEFKKAVSNKWSTIDHKFMDKQLTKLQQMVNANNVAEAINIGRLDKRNPKYKETEYWVVDHEYFKLTPESYFKEFEGKYQRGVVNAYEQTYNNINKGKMDKDLILENRLKTYDRQVNQVVTYFDKHGLPIRRVNLSTYLAMVHNVNLTRGAWNQTMSDANKLDRNMFIIPWHPFSCSFCLLYQNRPLTKTEVELVIGIEPQEQQGDILHPNCKCTLDIFWSPTQIQRQVYTYEEQEDFYKVRQKVNALTLEKSRLRTDMKSAELIGDMKTYDKLRQKVSVINSNIREQKNLLPTESLRKQVVAINR